METVMTAAGECTVAELASDWIRQMSDDDREKVRQNGAEAWREGVSQSETALTRGQVDEVLAEIERQIGR